MPLDTHGDEKESLGKKNFKKIDDIGFVRLDHIKPF